jgi:MFS family permease
MTEAAQAQEERARFRDVFASGEWRAIWLAYLFSIAGDQLAKVALTVLVFQRTGSPLWTALTYALTYLPWVIGLWLSGLADRYPRRTVMIVCDVLRAALVGVMALPGMPLAALGALIFLVTLLNAPFNSARSAERAAILSGDAYALGVAVSTITSQVGTVAGFAGGGAVVAALAPRGALGIDAATFAVSAILLRMGVRARPAPMRPEQHKPSLGRQVADGARLVFGDRRLRTAMLLGWLMAFYTVPEALAVPYAAHLHEGTVAAGVVFAAGPAGNGIGSAAFGRLVPAAKRLAWTPALAVLTSAVLIVCALQLNLVVSVIVFVASGALGAYQVAANAAFISAVPDVRRGQAFGLASTGLQVGQGVAYVIAGAIAFVLTPGAVIAVMGAAWTLAALALVPRRGLLDPAPSMLPSRCYCHSPRMLFPPPTW